MTAKRRLNTHEVDILQEVELELLVQDVLGKRSKGADEEEVREAVVHLTRRELALGTNNTPDDRRSSEDLSGVADEPGGLFRRAHARDVGKHPGLNAKLNGARNDCGNDLTDEHETRWDLHVVAELHVGSEGQSLRHGDVAVGLEQHHGQWATGQPVTDDQLSDDVETDLLVGDSLNHADRDSVDEGDEEGDDEGIYRELGLPNQDGHNGEGEHCHYARGKLGVWDADSVE